MRAARCKCLDVSVCVFVLRRFDGEIVLLPLAQVSFGNEFSVDCSLCAEKLVAARISTLLVKEAVIDRLLSGERTTERW